ncbi:sulfatase-like hydrolase/transferase [Bacteroides acidifaciens]|uniref:sulfatase-like hydrolase/transferase n=1 Tax=Bacteroides acidifaciens TaxID=85831 RepID=UPI0026EC4654|nr:sulfatase-like hydrolase/transferase [Bacteroides acidifaciens]
MMTMKTLLSASLALTALSSCQSETENPNILFLLVDDMQSDAIAALGNKNVYTPNIDGLIAKGVTFTRTYTNGALCGALSMPSRAMLMTGRGLFEVQSDGMKIPECMVTLPEQLRANGYRTFATGKWHSDHASFNRSFAAGENIFFGGMHRYEKNGHCSPHLHHYDETGQYKGTSFIGEEFSSKMFADAAIGFLKTAAEDKAPFMAFVSFTSPHDPRNQLPDYGKKYKAEEITLPPNFLPQHPFDNGELAIRDEQILPSPRSGEQLLEELALYYGMVSEVDEQIGRILKALDATGERDRTIIVFASDNGLAMGQNGLLGKQSLYDHSVGVPMLIIDPRNKKQGTKNDALCYLYDLYPTLCDMVGIEIPTSVTGLSLKPLLEGATDKLREDVFLAYSNQQRALVKDNYKYIIYNVNGKITEQFFDLKKDPGEMINLADAMPQKASTYKKLLSQRLKEHQDFCNLDTPFWWEDGHKITWNELIKLYIFE